MRDIRKDKLLTLLDPISLAKLLRDIELTLSHASLSLSEIIDAFSDRLPPRMSYARRDRFFNAVLQKMRKERRIQSVKRRWVLS